MDLMIKIYTHSGSRSDLLRSEGQNTELQVDIFLMIGRKFVHKSILDLKFETPIEITKCDGVRETPCSESSLSQMTAVKMKISA